ncbi:hypothetical protein BDB00DRAFT_805617 [Zychaea mexicana]|uniref:uncharacterized protein n=1 Tax=Zychaea mexicana TaxID=64656 RepID=UPI0022FDBC80|nr:uncharacterized protein BDB00DRAFT_805617 [Zychaea mexicana]KAI9497237.1 hypothetical protein BDB00DRAFT_805617 [Zychaea mexicana]
MFKKLVDKLDVKNYSKTEQPDWEYLKSQIAEGAESGGSSSKGSLGKRSFEEQRTNSTSTSAAASASISNGTTPTTSTDSTNKRRKKLTDYLVENSAPVITLHEGIAKWEVAGVTISEKLLDYRQATIVKAESKCLDTYQEELSINSIFLFDAIHSVYPSSCLEYGFKSATWEAITEECHELYPLEQLSDSIEATISKFAKAAKRKYAQCTEIIDSIPHGGGDDTRCIKESLRNIVSVYSPRSSKKTDKAESTFSISAVYPLVLSFLEETDMTTRVGTDGRAHREKTESSGKGGYQFSDLSVNFEYGLMPKQGLLIVEIKPPHKVRTGSRPDLVKLANEMKDSLDKMVQDGVDNPKITILGLLVEGFRCTLFVMDLKYQAVYRLIPLAVFYIPRDLHDFDVLSSSFEALVTMRQMVSANANLCFDFHRNKKREIIRGKHIIQSCRPKNGEK